MVNHDFWNQTCRYCGRRNSCVRKLDKRVQSAMMHLYVDVSTKSNSNLTNDKRRYFLYNFDTANTRGQLRAGEMYPLQELFPSNVFTDYKTL